MESGACSELQQDTCAACGAQSPHSLQLRSRATERKSSSGMGSVRDGGRLHTLRFIPWHPPLNRCHLVAVLALLEQHLAVSADRYVQVQTSCEYTRYGCNEVASWNPASKCGGGRFSRHNDLWLEMKKLCCGDHGLNLLCTPLPLAESLRIGALAYRTLSGTGQLPLPIGIAGKGGVSKLTKQVFNNAVLTAHEHQQRWYSDAAVGDRQHRIQSRAAECGFRVGSAPGVLLLPQPEPADWW
jgi:hypothetical protein